MACLRARWGHNNVSRCLSDTGLDLTRCHPYTSLSKNILLNGRSSVRWQQYPMSRVPRLSVFVNGVAEGVAVNSESSSSMFDHVDVRNTKGVLDKKKVVDEEEIVSGKVDQWIRESVEEIVSNIEEAPFLVQIYSDNEQGSSSTSTKTRVVREKASADSWPFIKRRWEGGSSIPNGIALVEELKSSHNSLPTSEEKLTTAGTDNQPCSSTKVWGIVIQERGVSCPACYILKTSRVRSVSGICTHFCLFRSECFTEYADMQLKKLWLL